MRGDGAVRWPPSCRASSWIPRAVTTLTCAMTFRSSEASNQVDDVGNEEFMDLIHVA
jgi:hypothetical protein